VPVQRAMRTQWWWFCMLLVAVPFLIGARLLAVAEQSLPAAIVGSAPLRSPVLTCPQ
jgi:hypothetical protein